MSKLNQVEIERNVVIDEDGLHIKMKRSDTEFCIIESIEVNGNSCYFFDLGKMKDVDPDNAPTCGCGNRQFIPKPPSCPVLSALQITEEEYYKLMKILERELFVGKCKRCR